MPSSYTTSLRLTLPATGELAGQWGNTVNQGITELLDAAVAGTASISTWGGAGVAYTLSNNSGAADEARKMFIVASGSPGEAKNVICPAVSKFYVFRNDTTGGFALTLKTSGGTGIAVPAGQYKFLYCDGTNVVEMFNSAGALTLSGALTVGGTTTLASNPTLSAGTANQVQYLNGSKVLVGSSNMTFDGTALTLGGNPTLSGGTANGVLYLNGSKVATSGSALVFDGASLGVGTASPYADTGFIAVDIRGSTGAQLQLGTTSGREAEITGTSTGGLTLNTINVTPIRFFINGNEQMRLTSTGLGIGTSSPAYKLDVLSSGDLAARAYTTGTSNSASIILQSGNGTTSGLFAYARFINNDTNAQDWRIGTYGTNNFSIFNAKASTTPFVLDTSGNLGLGVTPSGWGTYKALQVGGAGYGLMGGTSGTVFGSLATNAYYDGTNWKYVNSSYAQRYDTASGEHRWFNSASGTAGNTISFGDPKMTLDASGNLVVGTTTADSARLTVMGGSGGMILNDGNGRKLKFDPPGSINSNTAFIGTTTPHPLRINSGTSTNEGVLIFSTEDTERARITSGGEFVIGGTSASSGFPLTLDKSTGGGLVLKHNGTDKVYFFLNGSTVSRWETVTGATIEVSSGNSNGVSLANGGTSWGSLSDERKKDIIEPITDAANKVSTLRSVIGKYKTDYDGTRRAFLIAQDVQAVLPEAVVEAASGDLILQYTETIPLLVAAIKEQQALITDLRARVAALEAKP